jgi:hypothetical protein
VEILEEAVAEGKRREGIGFVANRELRILSKGEVLRQGALGSPENLHHAGEG